MKIFLLDCGYLVADYANVMADKEPGEQKCQMPCLAVLIKTEYGNVLYDTGCRHMSDRWPSTSARDFPLYQDADQRLENQLALCGVLPNDIDKVVMSHLHFDHTGGMELFPHAEFYVPKEEYISALVSTHITQDLTKRRGYFRDEVTAPAKCYHLIEDDFELFPGVEVVHLPGHVPSLLGVAVHTENSGTFIFPQDAVYNAEIYGPPIKLASSGNVDDKQKFLASVERVHKLQEKYDATVVFGHDYEQFCSLKHAPDFYD